MLYESFVLNVKFSITVSGFVLGPLGKIGNSKMSCYFVLIDCTFIFFMIAGMTMTLIYRYTSIFPGIIQTIGTSKWMIIACLTLQLFFAILISLVSRELFSFDHSTIIRKAIEFSPVLSRFADEPTIVFIDRKFVFPILIGAGSALVLISILFIFVAAALIVELNRSKYISKNLELQKTLIISCVVQIGVTFVFVFVPQMVLFYYMTYGYAYGGPIIMIIFCMASLHAIIEMSTTIYFVLPYKKFVKGLLAKRTQTQKISHIVSFIASRS